MTPPPGASGVGDIEKEQMAENNPQGIQARIDALLIAWQYAPENEKQTIQARIDALQIALEYA